MIELGKVLDRVFILSNLISFSFQIQVHQKLFALGSLENAVLNV